jgi:DNA repair exonuclease SbcCD ATPase subunit
MPFAERFELRLPAGPIAVVGSHSGDARRSNRAGKTALLEAITWCLYGVHRKRFEDAIIHRSSSACEVTVNLEGMIVKRSRSRGSSTKLVVRDRDIFKGVDIELTGDAAQNAVLRELGLGLDDYLATVCFRQGDVESIISRGANDRLALVSEWLQLTKWLASKKIQSARANATDTKLAEARASLEIEAQYLLSDERREDATVELAALKKKLAALDHELQTAQSRFHDSVAAKAQLAHHGELVQLRESAAELRTKLKGRAEAEKRRAEAAEEESRLRALATEADRAVKELDVVQREGFDGRCPVTCEACPVKDEVTEFVRSASELHATRANKYAVQRRVWVEARASLESARKTAAEFERFAAQYQLTVNRGKELSESLTMTEEEATAAPSAQALQLEFEEARSRHSEALTRATELESMLSNATLHVARYDVLALKVRDAERESQACKLALRAISSVPARIAEQQLGELEQGANVLLQGSGVSLRFSWARELAEKSPICEDCGHVFKSKRGDECPSCRAARGKKLSQELEFLCEDGSGVEEDVRYNSGGTRAIVGSAIRLGASAMLRRIRSSPASWAIVDEPFGSLDVENREQLARTFAGMLGSVGLEQAIVVSHDPALVAALPHRIVIDKDGSSSTARVE